MHAQGEDNGENTDEIYISIPDDKWDEFANDFSIQAYNNKEDYKKNSLLISAILAFIGGVVTYFISGHALRPIREFSSIREAARFCACTSSILSENSRIGLSA